MKDFTEHVGRFTKISSFSTTIFFNRKLLGYALKSVILKVLYASRKASSSTTVVIL